MQGSLGRAFPFMKLKTNQHSSKCLTETKLQYTLCWRNDFWQPNKTTGSNSVCISHHIKGSFVKQGEQLMPTFNILLMQMMHLENDLPP